MLIKCPECDLQISDKAVSCPHCGYPMKPEISPKKRTNHKHRRLPNGFGQISEIKSGNLRNRFRAMVTVGKTDTGRPIQRTLKPQAYFKTYNEAYQALMEYNKNPYDLESNITLETLYNKWFGEYKNGTRTASTIRTMAAAWNYCDSVKDKRVADIRARDLRQFIDTAVYRDNNATPLMKKKIKEMFNLMYDYAVEYEIIDKNIARSFNLSSEISKQTSVSKKPHMAFADYEMELLWQNQHIRGVNMILIQCYTGWRPQELVCLETANINLDKGYIVGGMKTEAGKDRKIPIHSKIFYLIKNIHNKDNKYLFPSGKAGKLNDHMTYDAYKYIFKSVMNKLNINRDHRPHDCRVQFISMLKNAGADEYAIKYLVGHAIDDITEKVYTRRNPEWLKTELEKIK